MIKHVAKTEKNYWKWKIREIQRKQINNTRFCSLRKKGDSSQLSHFGWERNSEANSPFGKIKKNEKRQIRIMNERKFYEEFQENKVEAGKVHYSASDDCQFISFSFRSFHWASQSPCRCAGCHKNRWETFVWVSGWNRLEPNGTERQNWILNNRGMPCKISSENIVY